LLNSWLMNRPAIARALRETADLLALTGGEPFRARAYERGARVLERLDDADFERLVAEGRLTTKDVFFAPVLVSGRRLRVGGDLDWRPGPLGIRAEFLRADDAQGVLASRRSLHGLDRRGAGQVVIGP